jgi:phage terminase small subunit
MTGKKLTHLQERFKNNILSGMDGKAAYIAAGYKARGAAAEAAASRLLRNVKVRAKLRKGRKKARFEAEIRLARILEEEALIAFSDIGNLFDEKGELIPPEQLPEDVSRAIAKYERRYLANGTFVFKVRFWDKGKSLERIERYLGMFEKDNNQKRDRIIIAPEAFERPKDAGT